MHSHVMKSGLFALVLVLAMFSPLAYGDMLVSPIRGLLQQPGESMSFVLRNPTNGSRSYRLEWGEYAQNESGVGALIPHGAVVPHGRASPHLRVTPRQITVPPNSNQTVRVSFQPQPGLAPGEYRSHLVFRVIPEVSAPAATQTIGGGNPQGAALVVDMQLSVSVPVVVRHQLSGLAQVKIDALTPKAPTKPGEGAALALTLLHQGPSSSFGRVVVEHLRDQASPPSRIGLIQNISVFPDVGRRSLIIPLAPEANLSSGLLRISYEGTDEYAGRIWDARVLQLQ